MIEFEGKQFAIVFPVRAGDSAGTMVELTFSDGQPDGVAAK